MTGMQGVYTVATELTRRGLVVSPTSRSAYGADLLVTDQLCNHAWSVQVKTNFGRPKFWLLNKHARETKSNTHVYVLVNLGQKNDHQKSLPADFFVVPSRIVAGRMRKTPGRERTRTIFYSIFEDKIIKYKNGWNLFGKQIQ